MGQFISAGVLVALEPRSDVWGELLSRLIFTLDWCMSC